MRAWECHHIHHHPTAMSNMINELCSKIYWFVLADNGCFGARGQACITAERVATRVVGPDFVRPERPATTIFTEVVFRDCPEFCSYASVTPFPSLTPFLQGCDRGGRDGSLQS